MASAEYHHLYNTAEWRGLRKAQLRLQPLCRLCFALGQMVAAGVVDHIKAHRGDRDLFRDPGNLQSLCKHCHDGHKQAQERNASGLMRGAGRDGRPLDLAHPWHRDAAQVGGGQKSTAPPLNTGPISPLAKPRNGMGGGL